MAVDGVAMKFVLPSFLYQISSSSKSDAERHVGVAVAVYIRRKHATSPVGERLVIVRA